MGRKVKKLVVPAEVGLALAKGYREGGRHCYRIRCQIILLKLEGYKSKEIGKITACCEMSVNNWVKRFEILGLEGLETKAGRGRKAILNRQHLPIVAQAVKQERQRLNQAQKIIEENIGRPMSKQTLTRFLKVVTAVTSE